MPVLNQVLFSEQVNPSQQEAILHRDGPALILAGPGSGKTYTITKRIQHLIQVHHIEPSNILVVSFTKASAMEMQERFCTMMKEEYAPVMFGTFHSIFFRILKSAYPLQKNSVLTQREKMSFLERILECVTCDISISPAVLDELLKEFGKFKTLGQNRELFRSSLLDAEMFWKIYALYEKEVRDHGKIDFDDMIIRTKELLSQRDDILFLCRERFQYILIDEFQDCNRMQYEVMKMIAFPKNHIYVVGDDDQSIYGFRGASPDIMQSFLKDFPEAKKVTLNRNYRSDRKILELSQRVICKNKLRFHKNLNSISQDDGIVRMESYNDREEQAEKIENIIERVKKDGMNYSDISIIYRTNHEAIFLTDYFCRKKIPFFMKEALFIIYDHFICQDILSYVRLTRGVWKRKDFLEIMNRPKRYLTRSMLNEEIVSIQQLREKYKEKSYMKAILQKLEYDLKRLRSMEPYAFLTYLRKAVGYEDYLREYAISKQEEVSEYLTLYDELMEISKDFHTFEEWEEHMELYRNKVNGNKEEFISMGQKEVKDLNKDERGIGIYTMHGCKGLEFNVVIIPNCNEGSIPHKQAFSQEELEEERRIFYVGITRAKRQLYLLYHKSKKDKKNFGSRFIRDFL